MLNLVFSNVEISNIIQHIWNVWYNIMQKCWIDVKNLLNYIQVMLNMNISIELYLNPWI